MIIALVFAIWWVGAQTEVDILSLITNASGPALMAVIIWGAIQEWWVPGRTHRRMVSERDELLRLALRSATAAVKSTTVAETLVRSEQKE